MSFWIILMVGILEGLIVHPLIYGQGWGKKGDMATACAGAVVSTVIYFLAGFPVHNQGGIIFTSVVGATIALLTQYTFLADTTEPMPSNRRA